MKDKYISPATYFSSYGEQPNGVNADIERHDRVIKELTECLQDETKPDYYRLTMEKFLRLVNDSKAKVLEQLGKSK